VSECAGTAGAINADEAVRLGQTGLWMPDRMIKPALSNPCCCCVLRSCHKTVNQHRQLHAGSSDGARAVPPVTASGRVGGDLLPPLFADRIGQLADLVADPVQAGSRRPPVVATGFFKPAARAVALCLVVFSRPPPSDGGCATPDARRNPRMTQVGSRLLISD
jgi:hypothetical protein